MVKHDWLKISSLILVGIGAINWGTIGFFNFNLVQALINNVYVDRVIYSIVGIAGVIFAYKQIKK